MDLVKANDIVRKYDVHGVKMAFGYATHTLMERAESLLAPFLYASSEDHTLCQAHISYAEIPTECACPDGMHFFGKGPLVKGTDQYCWTSQRARRILVPGLCLLHINHDTARADLKVAPGAEWSIPFGLAVPTLAEFLREHGQHIIHSAVLTATHAGEEKAILITGESGRGKSSTALACAGAGMKLLADDTAFIFLKDNRLRIWGLPLACKVHENTFRLLPWLNELPKGATLVDNETSMDLCGRFGPGATASANPQVVVFLHERNPFKHVIEPLDKYTALRLFTDDNLRRLDTLGQGHSGEAFRLYGRLVADCLTLRVSAGPDLAGLPDAIVRYLKWDHV